MPPEDKKYDVALSFAGEQREYVEATAAILRDAGVRVFYDDYEAAQLWGKNLLEHFDWVYRQASEYCVMFVSDDYAKKAWTSAERRSAQARAMNDRPEYILPVRFDDTEIPGLLPTISYLRAESMQPRALASAIIEKLGPRELAPAFPQNVDGLFKALGIKQRSQRERRKRREVRRVAESFYDALGRMTESERLAVCGLLAFGCPAELPDGVHISLDLLGRMIDRPASEVLDNLAAIRSLNVHVVNREQSDGHGDHDLVPDDRDILLAFWSSAVPDCGEATEIAYEMIHCATEHFCADHGLSVVMGLDFTNLAPHDLVRPVRLPGAPKSLNSN